MKKILLTFMLAVMAITAQAVTEFTVGSLKYYIETTGDAYCNGLAASAGNPTTITIPGRVTYNGTTYYVMSGSPAALVSCIIKRSRAVPQCFNSRLRHRRLPYYTAIKRSTT